MAKGSDTVKVEIDRDQLRGLAGELIYETLVRYTTWLEQYWRLDAPDGDELVRSFMTQD